MSYLLNNTIFNECEFLFSILFKMFIKCVSYILPQYKYYNN